MAVAVALVLAAGCADDDPSGSDAGAGPTPAPTSTSTSTSSAPAAQGPAAPPATPPEGRAEDGPATTPGAWEQAAIRLEPVAEIPQAVALAARPGTPDLYVAGRDGRLWRLSPAGDGAWGEPEPVLDLRGEVTTDGERGLLSLAFAPDGSTLYLSRTDRSGRSIVEAVPLAGAAPDPAARRVLLDVEQPFANHNGGHVAVDGAGLLYLGLGDGGGAGDPLGTGQDPHALLGSLLRIDPRSPSGGAPYGIPPDNPFADGAAGAPEVWAYGLRNPWRFSFDRATGDLWVADVGQDRWEEVDVLRAADGLGRGANLGWNRIEGAEPFEGGTEPEGHHRPAFVYARSDGRCSIIGGVVYRGAAVPELTGVYVYGDLCSGEVRGLQLTPAGVVEAGLPIEAEPGSLVSFGEDAAGELYVLELRGRVSRVVPSGG